MADFTVTSTWPPVYSKHTNLDKLTYLDCLIDVMDGNSVMRKLGNAPKRSIPGIRQIYFNRETGYTTIVWEDKTSTVVHCGEGEKFEDYLGFCAAVCKKLFGSTSAAKKVMEEKDAELQKAKKEEKRQKAAETKRKEEAENRDRKKKAELEKVWNKLRNIKLPNIDKIDVSFQEDD